MVANEIEQFGEFLSKNTESFAYLNKKISNKLIGKVNKKPLSSRYLKSSRFSFINFSFYLKNQTIDIFRLKDKKNENSILKEGAYVFIKEKTNKFSQEFNTSNDKNLKIEVILGFSYDNIFVGMFDLEMKDFLYHLNFDTNLIKSFYVILNGKEEISFDSLSKKAIQKNWK